ncbi:hypothetical protein Dxin01_03940 [Deinococcus xinjiangensis]|uniref:Uncharacterized protein n=1 Tax=Deinococcus xinjiangensis TaxID=457454 RepID=A0ABP9VHR6_9DEIO
MHANPTLFVIHIQLEVARQQDVPFTEPSLVSKCLTLKRGEP